jgi:hypothetical protein
MPPRGIRTRAPSNHTAADLRLRTRGHWAVIAYYTLCKCIVTEPDLRLGERQQDTPKVQRDRRGPT